MVWIGFNKIYGSLRRNYVVARKRNQVICVNQVSWNIAVKAIIIGLSNGEFAVECGGTIWKFGNIYTRKFMNFVGHRYCWKRYRGGGVYYIDNVEIKYDINRMAMEIKWLVVDWDKNGNHMRWEAPW